MHDKYTEVHLRKFLFFLFFRCACQKKKKPLKKGLSFVIRCLAPPTAPLFFPPPSSSSHIGRAASAVARERNTPQREGRLRAPVGGKKGKRLLSTKRASLIAWHPYDHYLVIANGCRCENAWRAGLTLANRARAQFLGTLLLMRPRCTLLSLGTNVRFEVQGRVGRRVGALLRAA